MIFSHWLRSLQSRRNRSLAGNTRRTQKSDSGKKLALEVLEDRTAPAVLTVNSLADTVSGSTATLDLREAVLLVNSGGTATDSSNISLSTAKASQIDTSSNAFGSNDTIQFDPGLFGLGQQTITLGGNELLLSTSVIINGPGAGLLAVSGNGQSRVLNVAYGTDTLSGLTIQNGSSGTSDGGGILNSGNLTVSGCTLSGNSAGVIFADGSVSYYDGAGIANFGNLTVSGCTLSGNSATGSGGGIFNFYGNLTISGSTVSENTSGGGIWTIGTLMMSDCTLSQNVGGGIYNAGTLTINNCTLAQNSGGAIDSTGIMAATGCTVSDNYANNGGGISTAGFATISGCVVSGNRSLAGAGIYASGSLNLTDSIVSGNTADEGAGIFSTGIAGAVYISGSAISGNTATFQGGGIYNLPYDTIIISDSTISGNFAALDGGGIENSGTMTVSSTSISGNSAASLGGGIDNRGGFGQYQAALTVSTSALWGNAALAGGGICTSGWATVTVSDSTVVGNSASDSGGGIRNLGGLFLGGIDFPSSVTINHSTLSGNTASADGGGGIDIGGFSPFAVGSHSAIVDNQAPADPAGADLDNSFGGGGSIDESAVVNIDGFDLGSCSITYGNANDTATALTASVNAQGQIVYTAHVVGVDTALGSSPLTVTSGTVLLHYNGTTAAMTLDSNTDLYNLSPISDPAQLPGILASPSPLYAEFVPGSGSGFNGSTSAHLLQAADALIPSNLQAMVTSLASSPATAVSLNANPSSVGAAVTAIQKLTAPGPVTIVLNLASGTYSGQTLSVPNNVSLVINGSATSTLPTTVDPDVPALVINSGNVIITNVTFTESGAAPTILVNGGHLTLRNDVVQESTGYSEPAIQVSGGTLDLGTTASPGGNTINVNGSGQVILNTGVNIITSVGDSFQANGSAIFPFAKVGLVSAANPAALNQPVSFTASVIAPTSTSSTPTGTVTFLDTTTGSTLGAVSLSGSNAQLTVSSLALGNHTIAAVYSGDANYLSSSATLVEKISTYVFSGFQPPLNSTLPIALGRSVPIKFQLSNANGFISSLSVVTSLQVISNKSVNVLTNSGSTALRYDLTSNQFVANWQTKGLPAGTYTVKLVLADGTVYSKVVQLTKNGNSSGLTSTAAGGTGGAAGALLGGDIDLYVDNTNGDLTADELARIQDAVTAADAVTEPYGVAVQIVSDPTLADVTLNMDTTSAVGGYADGVLGCTTDAGQITLITGWNFYAGSDATQIGSAQYDFETVVTHELGHALGLGHSTDSTSVMYATLNAGAVNRTLTTADLNVADSDTTGACGLHAVAVLAPAGAMASALPTTSLADPDAYFVSLMNGVSMPALAANALLSARAHDAVFADPLGDVGTTVRVARLASENASPIFGGSSLSQTDDELPVGRLDARFDFLPADGSWGTEI